MAQAGVIGSGGNSGFQAFNLVMQFTSARVPVILVGFDMRIDQGIHWHGRHVGPGANNPTNTSIAHWRTVFRKAAVTVGQWGTKVYNACPASALLAFPVMTFEEALAHVDRP